MSNLYRVDIVRALEPRDRKHTVVVCCAVGDTPQQAARAALAAFGRGAAHYVVADEPYEERAAILAFHKWSAQEIKESVERGRLVAVK